MESSWTIRDWWMMSVFCISMATLIYTIISTHAIRGNELKHIMNMLKDIVKRVERLENTFIKGGKE